jgi:hypothetical protein
MKRYTLMRRPMAIRITAYFANSSGHVAPTAIPMRKTAHFKRPSCHQVNVVDENMFIKKMYLTT